LDKFHTYFNNLGSKNAVLLLDKFHTYFNNFIQIFNIMDFDYLFYNDLPKGVKSVYVNGKRMSLGEFNEAKKEYLSKKETQIES